eukprot:14143384-Heterocapsa_arctica.AAC.1
MIHSKVDKESKTKDTEHKTAKKQDESQALTVKKEDLEDKQKKVRIESCSSSRSSPSMTATRISLVIRSLIPCWMPASPWT